MNSNTQKAGKQRQDKVFRVEILTFQKVKSLPSGSRVQKDDEQSTENKHLDNFLRTSRLFFCEYILFDELQ